MDTSLVCSHDMGNKQTFRMPSGVWRKSVGEAEGKGGRRVDMFQFLQLGSRERLQFCYLRYRFFAPPEGRNES